ncbi:hypothetical protein SKAU_G00094120 [Synaphobranchus kaupii]|uniref:DDE Tnp4 domain-containing protein n=1 Tax=Synaphobranchus kaupii TaxID=118154 RepID=A0A9Q1FWZ4_SYNKA|nr:hypothetical protein SKAU_G00094120 [Synaphobranchus kaupii]
MKTRWRSIFLKALEVQIPFAVEVIDCCAVLHNLCMKTNDLLDPAADDDDDDDDASESHSDEEQDPGNRTSADGLRAQVAAAASAPMACIPALGDHDYTKRSVTPYHTHHSPLTFWEALDQRSRRASCQYLLVSTGKLMIQQHVVIIPHIICSFMARSHTGSFLALLGAGLVDGGSGVVEVETVEVEAVQVVEVEAVQVQVVEVEAAVEPQEEQEVELIWPALSSEGKERTLPPGADDEPIATGVMLWLDSRALSMASYRFQVAAFISPPSVLLPVGGFFNS